MNDSIEKKNIMVIVFEIAVIASGIFGITFATSKIINDRTSTIITTGEYQIDYVGDKLVKADNIMPISDKLININTKDNVIRLEFSVRGVKQNKNDELIYDVMFDEMKVDCSLLNQYTKWNLYKNGELLSTGSLDPKFDGDVLGDNIRLTTTQETLKKYNEDYDNYVLILWISEACEDLEKCTLVDQSKIVDSELSMKVFIALYSGEKTIYNRTPNMDTSCANKPELYNNMIPVMYKDGAWVVADKTNSQEEYKWYDYNNGIWANSFVVNTSKYANVGDKIADADIVSEYVWIPRYRYKLWNAGDTATDTYNAYDNGIEIIFENGLNKIENETVNDKYITHPAFNNVMRGFWINKYELSKNNALYQSIPGKESYTSDTLENYKNICGNLVNDYLLGNMANTRIVNNLEWGATLYLSHSKYGVCKNNGCDKIGVNETYTAGANKQDTTTRNIYGVYDMAGASSEYVNGASSLGSATKEVFMTNGTTWYNGISLYSNRDYILRGGINRGLFYFGDISMSETKYGARSVIVNN